MDMDAIKRFQRLRASASGLLLLLLLTTAHAQRQGWTGGRRGAAGKDLNAVYFMDARRGWAAGDDGLVLRTNDGGRSWVTQAVGTGGSINDLYFRDKDNGYLLTADRILRTVDGGVTWREVRRLPAAEFGGAEPELYSVRFAGKKKGWAVGSISRSEVVVDSLVLYTDDGGETWRRQIVPTRDELIHLDFDGDKRGWIVGDKGTILHTADGGQTWTRQRVDTKATLYHIEFINNERGWAVGQRGSILRTVDGGDSWTSVAAPQAARATLLSVGFANSDDGWIVGRGGIILRSGDGGLTWVRQEVPTTQNLYALSVGKKRCWVVGGDGIVLQYER